VIADTIWRKGARNLKAQSATRMQASPAARLRANTRVTQCATLVLAHSSSVRQRVAPTRASARPRTLTGRSRLGICLAQP
jgi:hypothetical protein